MSTSVSQRLGFVSVLAVSAKDWTMAVPSTDPWLFLRTTFPSKSTGSAVSDVTISRYTGGPAHQSSHHHTATGKL